METLENCWNGLSEVTWLGIFTICKVLIPGIILALFTAYYQNRKKREIKVEGKIAKLRIEAYQKIAFTFSKIYETQSPSLKEEEAAKKILSGFDFPDMNMDYSSVFENEKEFDNFYYALMQVGQEYGIYLDYPTAQQLKNSIAVFTHCKLFLDAFCDTEHRQTKKDMAYMLMGIALKNEINRTFLEMEEVLALQLQHLRLTYRSYWWQRLKYTVSKPFLRIADTYLTDSSWRGYISQWFLLKIFQQRHKAIICYLSDFIQILGYVHVSDRYSPEEYFNKDENERMNLNKDFFVNYFAQLHNG